MTVSQDLSLSLPDIAKNIEEQIEKTTGQKLGFVLVISADNIAQYISNLKRSDGEELLKSLLTRWENKRADIPAHYNPDLKNVDR